MPFSECEGCYRVFEHSHYRRVWGYYCNRCAQVLRHADLGPDQNPGRTEAQIDEALRRAGRRP